MSHPVYMPYWNKPICFLVRCWLMRISLILLNLCFYCLMCLKMYHSLITSARVEVMQSGWFVWHSFCLSVGRITAKVIIRFHWNLVKKSTKYVDLYSTSSRSTSDVLPFPISRHWSPQANPTARHQRTLRDHVIRVVAPHDMPVYSPGLGLDRLRLSRPGCLVPRRGGLPVQRRLPI